MTNPGPDAVGTPPGAAPPEVQPSDTAVQPSDTAVQPVVAEPAAPRRGRAATVIFAVLALLLLLSTGAMTALYLKKSKDVDKLTTQLKDRETAVAQSSDKIKSLTKQMDDAKQAQGEAEKKLTSYQNCVTAIRAAAYAEVNGTPDPVKQQKANEACLSIFLAGN
jgi:septal ring factor EnvC (AmiA/AmiB activator)